MGYLCDWMNNAKSVQWFSFLNVSQNRWATNLIQEDYSFIHSVICYWFLSLLKVKLIDWLTYCVNHRINQPIHERINDAHFMHWITNTRLSLLTNGTLLQGYCIFIILSFNHLLLFLSRECMIEGLNRCLFCMLLSI